MKARTIPSSTDPPEGDWLARPLDRPFMNPFTNEELRPPPPPPRPPEGMYTPPPPPPVGGEKIVASRNEPSRLLPATAGSQGASSVRPGTALRSIEAGLVLVLLLHLGLAGAGDSQ